MMLAIGRCRGCCVLLLIAARSVGQDVLAKPGASGGIPIHILNPDTHLQMGRCSNRLSQWQIRRTDADGIEAPVWINATVPGTTLSNLIDAGALDDYLVSSHRSRDPYFAENLAKLPDINATGRSYYSYSWRLAPGTTKKTYCAQKSLPQAMYTWLQFRGVGYRSRAYLAGKPLRPANLALSGDAIGMWRRWRYNVTDRDPEDFILEVEPPDHPGIVSSACPLVPAIPCGQGGDHQLAQDAGAMQFAAGWDWAQGIPDRVTGIFDVATLIHTGPVLIEDPMVATVALVWLADQIDALLRVRVGLVNADMLRPLAGILWLEMDGVKLASLNLTLAPGEVREVSLRPLKGEGDLVELSNAKLWWPHTLGEPYLYDAEFFFVASVGQDASFVSDSQRLHVGIRHVETYIDQTTGGRAFRVNGHEIFLVGGNWIATDAMLRFSGDASRYDAEVRMHMEAGLNLIRVWGGGLTERPEFYQATDRYGMLVMQEFWMSGDNNGRWAGSYSWPLDHPRYLDNARDMIRMLRSHASLLFWCFGNELYPSGRSPPTDIDAGLQELLAAHDWPSRPWIHSSMDGGVNGSNMSEHLDDYALAVKDGPYGFLFPAAFFDKNPGLMNGTNLSISFQPEVGSSAAPSFASLVRMLGAAGAAEFPSFLSAQVPKSWQYHLYEGYTTNGSYDHVYAYGPPRNTSEWCVRARLAQLQQYQALFEGYSSRMFQDYTAVILWKTQSPWPSLRGFLYDWFLAPAGGYDGVRAALRNVVHPQLNLRTSVPELINRGGQVLPPSELKVSLFGHEGKLIENMSFSCGVAAVPRNRVGLGGSNESDSGRPCKLGWPSWLEDEVLFIRVESTIASGGPTWYWLRDPALGDAMNFTKLGNLRESGPRAQVVLRSGSAQHEENGLWSYEFVIEVSVHSPVLLLAPVATLEFADARDGRDDIDARVLPAFFGQIPTVMLPGELVTVTVVASPAIMGDRHVRILLEAWDAPACVLDVERTRSQLAFV